jgi:putative oxidoreductase
MGLLHQLNQWSITHHPRWLVILRVALGFCLLLKGISFISNTVALQKILQESNLPANEFLSGTVAWLHLLGGFLIIPGLFTRWAVLAQIPVLLAAVILINAKRGVFAAESEFGFSLVILLLLIFFFFEGGGPMSLDDYFRKNPK